jgi:hypothetical protein
MDAKISKNGAKKQVFCKKMQFFAVMVIPSWNISVLLGYRL